MGLRITKQYYNNLLYILYILYIDVSCFIYYYNNLLYILNILI